MKGCDSGQAQSHHHLPADSSTKISMCSPLQKLSEPGSVHGAWAVNHWPLVMDSTSNTSLVCGGLEWDRKFQSSGHGAGCPGNQPPIPITDELSKNHFVNITKIAFPLHRRNPNGFRISVHTNMDWKPAMCSYYKSHYNHQSHWLVLRISQLNEQMCVEASTLCQLLDRVLHYPQTLLCSRVKF